MSEADGGDSGFSWKSFLQAVSTESLTSSVKGRNVLLKNKVTGAIRGHPMEDKELLGLILVLRGTVGLYVDKASRHAVLDVLRELAAKKRDVFVKAMVAVLEPMVETAQPRKKANGAGHPDDIATTAAYRFSILAWVHLALGERAGLVAKDGVDLAGMMAAADADDLWKKLVLMAARLLWGVSPALPGMHRTKVGYISWSAHRDLWRTIRAHPRMTRPMLAVLTSPENAGPEAAVLIGNAVSTERRIQGDENARRRMSGFKDAIVGYIDRVLICAKTPVSYSSVSDLRDFLQLLVGDDFGALFGPSISKMLVRSPETVLPTCLWLLQALDATQFDLTRLWADVFAEPLASSLLKSSNASVRGSAANLFAYLAGVPRTSEAARSAAETVTGPLVRGSYAQPEHRALLYGLLGDVRASGNGSWASSAVILAALLKMAAKETQEAPVRALFSAIGKHVGVVIGHLAAAGASDAEGRGECEEILGVFAEAARKGLALPERSAVVRRGWAADAVGEPLWAIFGPLDSGVADIAGSQWMAAHVLPLVAQLAATAEKSTAAPLAASGGTLEAHVGFALPLRLTAARRDSGDRVGVAGVDGARLVDAVVGTEKSLVLWDKVFHKCGGLRETSWLLRCATTLFADGCDDPRVADLLLWVACHRPSDESDGKQVVRAAIGALATMSRLDALRLWRLLEAPLFAEMTASLATEASVLRSARWSEILGAAAAGISSSNGGGDTGDEILRRRALVAMALAAHHRAVVAESGKTSAWVSLIQSASVDPGDLCRDNLPALRQCVVDALEAPTMDERGQAALNLIKDLVFIGGEAVAQRVLEYAHDSIDPAAISQLTADDLAVWRTPADQLHLDPVEAKRRTQGTARTAKNKDDLWAEQVKEEIARKKNIARKLSKEDQDLVDAQRAKETRIRGHVDRVHSGLLRGLAVVRAVVEGSASVASASMLELVRIVVKRAVIGGGGVARELAGREIVATMVALAGVADGLDADMRLPLTMGLLRARGFECVVPDNWMRETMESLATRVYYRLRVNCEASPLPPAGFNFLLPFMQATAELGGWGKRAATKKGVVEEHDEYAQMDSASEQLSMAVALLSFHAHFGNVEAMPRKEMLDLMVLVMATQPALLAGCRDTMVKMAEEMEGSDTPLERDALLAGLVQPDSAVRGACLLALDYVDLTDLDYSAPLWANVGGRGSDTVALEQNAELAQALWADNGMEAVPALVADLVPLLGSAASEVRGCAARSIGLAVREAREQGDEDGGAAMVAVALDELVRAYSAWHVSLEPEYDEYGIVVAGTQNRADTAEPRVAVADALYHLAPELGTADQVNAVIRFLVEDGVLGERSERVRAHMLAAGARAVSLEHGHQWSAQLMPTLERFLAERDRRTVAYDRIREGVVVLLGRLAQHLPGGAENDARVADAVDRLVATLATPSEAVQSAVGDCLPPLAKRIDEPKFAALVEAVLGRTLEGAKYSDRRGGAFGLAGLVRGRGLAALKRYGVIDRLRAACEDRRAQTQQQRQGALFAYETLASTVGRLFEPYVIQFIPQLLELFGDGSGDVRDAALDTARAIMGSISGHGVKLVLPAALAGLGADQWRTKKGSVEMLGSMAFCAPKQLSISLPRVVPSIIDALTDTHGQVSAAARQALLRFGDVIHNPEIQAIVPAILAALDDPAKQTDAALRTLLHTAFVHYVDAPSLALVVPVLERGMRERNASTKRSAAQIMGSMATLTDPKDLAPYLGSLVPLVRGVLVDPVPEARATAAKALGSLVQRLGEEQFPSLVADLIKVLKGGDASGVDRAGAAQGLSEVLAGVGVGRLEGLLPEVLASCNGAAQVPVREGFMTLLIYLPTTFGDDFRRFLPQVLAPVLAGLADENELVRVAAMRAGRILVVSYSVTEADVILPELLAALGHALWRIRQSSIELLGEFLYRMAGITGKQAERDREAARELFFAAHGGDSDAEEAGAGEEKEDEDDADNEAEEEAAISSNLREVLNEKLGVDRCQAVLAALYVARSDVSALVRQASFGVWKSIVHNTPRTVRESLSSIMEIVLVGLSSADYDRRTSAARTLGDLVHKLGEAVMSRVVPILRKALSATGGGGSSGVRHGVFVGLAEILHSTGKAYVDDYADAMVPLVRRGLCDADAAVREAAAAAFNALQQAVGPRAVDAVVPPLLAALTQRDGGALAGGDLDGIDAASALEALRELMAVRASAVFPVLIPTLTARPISTFNARALASLIQVSGGGVLGRRLPHILTAVFESLPIHHAAGDADAEAALRETVRVVVGQAAADEATLDTLMLKFHEMVKVGEGVDLAAATQDASRVAEACFAMEALCRAFGPNSAARGRSVLGAHVADWLRILIDLLAAPSPHVVRAAWAALDALCRAVPKDDYDGYVGPVSRAVQHATDQVLPRTRRTMPGFDLARGIGPLLPIYAQGLLAGSPDTKERAVRGMARLVRFTDPSALRLFATGITGPLIRIVGDRNPPNVKAAILSTLGLLLAQVPALMRPFLPQLQRTFVRALAEPDDIVRQRAAAALAALIPLQARLDPLVAELTAGLSKQQAGADDDLGMRMAALKAVCAVFHAPGAAALSAASVQTLEAVVLARGEFSALGSAAANSDHRWRALRSRAFGGLCAILPGDVAARMVVQHAIADPAGAGAGDAGLVQGLRMEFLAAVLAQAPGLVRASDDLQQRISGCVDRALLAPGGGGGQAALQAAGVAKAMLLAPRGAPAVLPGDSPLAQQLCRALVRVVSLGGADQHAVDADVLQAALLALKALAKRRFRETVEPVRDAVVGAAVALVRSRNIPVKLAAERCVLYALRLARVPAAAGGDEDEAFDGGLDGLDSYVAGVGGPESDAGRTVLDYHRRVMSKLADATRELDYVSDDDDDDDDAGNSSLGIGGDDGFAAAADI
ncbi:translational activator of GCN4 [Coemansia sp. RSA 1939]|nr:translational activator of GCN4 [Coemansia sp. RSA 1939]KAJ2603971.1 translational activator of GCN4 [Coemansia sp. RSA 1804]KAJ2691505.1 translational activator of GCN4 [Coemansia sp. RSA 1285]